MSGVHPTTFILPSTSSMPRRKIPLTHPLSGKMPVMSQVHLLDVNGTQTETAGPAFQPSPAPRPTAPVSEVVKRSSSSVNENTYHKNYMYYAPSESTVGLRREDTQLFHQEAEYKAAVILETGGCSDEKYLIWKRMVGVLHPYHLSLLRSSPSG
jgi:hypothetical protein